MMKPQRKFDPYAVLGVTRDAAIDAVKRAFRSKAKDTHPDAGGDRAAFERVQRAQMILLDPKRRKKYDETGDADEPDVQSPDHGALTMIAALLAQILADDSNDPFKHDLIEVICNSLRADEKKETQGLARAERSLKRIARMRSRFQKQKAGANVFEPMLSFSETQIREMIAKQKSIKADRARALEILAEYKFETDVEVQSAFIHKFAQGQIFGTGTSAC